MSDYSLAYDDDFRYRQFHFAGSLLEGSPDTRRIFRFRSSESSAKEIANLNEPFIFSVMTGFSKPIDFLNEMSLVPTIEDEPIPRTLTETIVQRIGQIDAVEKIYILEENGVKKVFTIINEDDTDIQWLIYDEEDTILIDYPNKHIQFRVIWRENRDLNSLVQFSVNPIYEK